MAYTRLKERLQQRSERGFGCDDVDGLLLAWHLLDVHKRLQAALTHEMDPQGCFDSLGICEATHADTMPQGLVGVTTGDGWGLNERT